MGALSLNRKKSEQVVIVDLKAGDEGGPGEVILTQTIAGVSGQQVKTRFEGDETRYGVFRAEVWEAILRDGYKGKT